MEHKFCPYCMAPVEDGKPCGACGLTQGSYTPSPHHLPPGTVLRERYLVGRVLGEGGFGITYIGCDLQLGLKVPGSVDVVVGELVTLTKTLRIGPGNHFTTFSLPLTIAEGGRVQVWGWLDSSALLRTMNGGTISVESDGSLGLIDSSVTNDGLIESLEGDLYQENTSLVNNGELRLTGWQERMALGDVTNHGRITVTGQRIEGTLVNEEDGTIILEWEDETLRVSGRLDNRGTIRGARGTYIETVDGGSFTGNPVVYGE